MAYATKQDLIDRFGLAELIQLTDRVNRPATNEDDTVIARALDDATAYADTYLARTAQLPLVPTPPQLVKAVADIARYYLHGRAAEKDGEVERAYREASALLRDIAAGRATLLQDGAPAAQPGGAAVKAVEPGRVFSRDSLGGL